MYLYSLLESAVWYPILFDTPLNAVRSVAIWLTLALVIAYLVCLFAVKADKKGKFLTRSAYGIVVYACALCTLFLILSFQEDGIEKILFIPLLVLLVCIAGGAATLFFKRSKAIYLTLGALVASAFAAVLICIGIHFASGKAAEINWLNNDDVQSVWLYIASAVSIAALLLIARFLGKNEPEDFDSKSITYAAICIAMSFALSFMRIVRLPQGGSITPASLLPLMIYAYMFGIKKGVFAGFAYGLLQAFQDPAVLHPAQFLLDYPVAFAWIGLAGLFSRFEKLDKLPQVQFAIGGVIAGLGRFFMHFLSGTFAFGVFAPEGTPAALYSFLYQAGYVLPDLAIAIAFGVALFSSKAFVKEVRKFRTLPLKKAV
ncbi:MAG: energy-coupled thiamine transporter ThiT [Clostridia bacterium]|nr:energy-coupled thiamine transporter ThiT [Clostridia bacterium]